MNFPWKFGVPLLMWWDSLDAYPDESSSGYGRNHSVSGSAQANYPPERFFNAVTAPQGSRCTDIDCPPLPGQPQQWQDASLIDAIAETVNWFNTYVQPSTTLNGWGVRTGAWAQIPERSLLWCYVRGIRETKGCLRWWEKNLGDLAAEIWSPLDEFLDGILSDADVQDRIAGWLLIDEAEVSSSRRLPRPIEVPQILGISGPLVEVGTNIELTAWATGDPYDWEWTFSGPVVMYSQTGNKAVINAFAPGTIVATVVERNWWGESVEYHQTFIAVASSAVTDPEVRLMATSGPEGLVRHALIDDGSGTLVGQALIPELGELILRPLILGSPLTGAGGATLKVEWTDVSLGDPSSPEFELAIPRTLLSTASRVTGNFQIEDPSNPGSFLPPIPFAIFLITPDPGQWLPPNWVHPRFLEAAAHRVQSVATAYGVGGLPFLSTHAACIVPAHFYGAEVPRVANVEETKEIDIPGCKTYGTEAPPAPSAFSYRMQPAANGSAFQDCHALDDYIIQAGVPTLRSELAWQQSQGIIRDADEFLENSVPIFDPLWAYRRLEQFRAALNPPGVDAFPFLLTLQAYGHPYIRDASDDPFEPTRMDGWNLQKPTNITGDGVDAAYAARFLFWYAIFKGTEGALWFAQLFVNDAWLEEVYNLIAAELFEYFDLRFNGFLLSNQGPSQVVFPEGAVPRGRSTMGFTVVPGVLQDQVITLPGNAGTTTGRTEQPPVAAMIERKDLYAGTRPAGQRIVFLLNPSYRARTFHLDFQSDYAGSVLREWRLGTHIGDISIVTTAGEDTPVRLRPYEVRIFEVVPPSP
ncbi:MAG: hypothetical protein GEEBNDBF_01822 [bacterium]|nr:hypothetical protein [bacterium]